MWVSDEELEMLGVRYEFNIDKVRDEYSTFSEYVLSYVNDKKGLMK